MKKVLIAFFLTMFFLFGCSTPEKIARLEGQGPVRIYDAPYAKTWKAAVDSAWNVGLTVLRVYPEQGFISAKRGMSATSFGEDVAIWLKEAGPGRTQVEVVSRQKGVPMIEVKHWEETMFQAISQAVGGKALAQGTAPVISGQARSLISESTYVSGLPVEVSLPAVNPPPVPKPVRTKTPRPEQLVLQQQPQTPSEKRINQGSAPGLSGKTRSELSDSTPGSSLPVQASLPTIQSAPVTKAPVGIKNSEPEQVVLHQKLQTHLENREQELKKETNPARRKLLETEIDYLREEVGLLESRIARSGK